MKDGMKAVRYIFLWYSKVYKPYHCENYCKLLPNTIFLLFLLIIPVQLAHSQEAETVAAAEPKAETVAAAEPKTESAAAVETEENSVTKAEPAVKKAERLAVDLDLKDVDIKDVARALSRISGKNIVVSEEIKAKVTLRVKDVDWREALNMVLSAYNFAMLEKEEYIVITTLEKRRQAEESGDLETRVISFNFINVLDVQKTLASMLSSRGKIEIDARTNSLVITDLPEKIDKIQKVAVRLDTLTPQVVIEAMMLDLKLTDEDQLGIDWTLTHKEHPERSIKQSLKLTGSISGEINYGKTIFPWANFTSLINLWYEQKRVNILANPRVLTLDNLTAAIELIEQVPYTQQSESTQGGSVSSTQFKDVGIKLYVKPHITKDNYIFLNIKTEQSFRSGFTPDSQPIIDARKAETNLMVKDGETIVIGGLRKKEDTVTEDRFPLLSRIPLLGVFFKRNSKSAIETELIIFVTPHVAGTVLTDSEQEKLEEFSKMKQKKLSAASEKDDFFPLRPPQADN